MDFLDRIGRPLTRLAVMVLVLAVTWVFIRLGAAMAAGFDRWSAGEGVDLNGLGAALGGAAALLGVLMPFIVSLFRDRRIERVEQIRAGGSAPANPSQAPWAPSQPSLPDDSEGPRPWQNRE
jgi:hypothetical protein